MSEEKENEKPKPYFVLDLEPVYRPRAFASSQDLLAWLSAEKEFFKFAFLDERSRNKGSPLSDMAVQHTVFDHAINEARAAADATPEVADIHLANVKAHLQRHIVDDRYVLLSHDPRAHYVKKLFEEKTIKTRIAAWTLMHFLGRTNNMNDAAQFAGAFNAKAFDAGIKGTDTGIQSALERLSSSYSSRLEALEAARCELETHTATTTTAAATAAGTRETDFTTAQTKRTEDFDKAHAKWADDLDQLTSTYNDHMAFEAPVKYWNDKANQHTKSGRNFAIAAALFLAGFVTLVSLTLPVLISIVKEAIDPTDKMPSVPVYVALATFALVGVWILRILIRLTLSHIHLATDAKHRSVSVQAYLSLLKNEKNAVGPEERAIILTQLFRPASDGLIRDDAMPISAFERLTRT